VLHRWIVVGSMAKFATWTASAQLRVALARSVGSPPTSTARGVRNFLRTCAATLWWSSSPLNCCSETAQLVPPKDTALWAETCVAGSRSGGMSVCSADRRATSVLKLGRNVARMHSQYQHPPAVRSVRGDGREMRDGGTYSG